MHAFERMSYVATKNGAPVMKFLSISERVRRECEERLEARLRRDAGVPPIDKFRNDRFQVAAMQIDRPFEKA